MKKHTKIYMDHFGYGMDDYKPCEWCGRPIVDVHHSEKRGMGGSKEKDKIELLIGVCREHHNLADNSPVFNEKLRKRHLAILKKLESDPRYKVCPERAVLFFIPFAIYSKRI